MLDLPDFSAAPWQWGASCALAQGADRLSYAGLHAQVIERARRLASGGLKPGEVVMVPDAPAWDLVIMQHSLARSGAALFPFRADLPAFELAKLSQLVGAEWRWHRQSACLERTHCSLIQSASADSTEVRALIKTSGSSGEPKVAMLTGANLLASALAANQRLGLGASDLWLACLRLSHIGGLAIGYRCALAGATLLLHDGFDAAAVARDLAQWPVTHLSLVPPMLARLLDLGCLPPAQLSVLLVGGQAVSPSLARRALGAGWPLHLTYGMTETTSQIATRKVTAIREPDATLAGEPLPGVELDLHGCDAATRPPRPLRVRGPMVMAGYAGPDRLPGRGLQPGGWLEAADLACLSSDGQLRILGRADDVLVIGGVNVSRAAVQRRVCEAPGVRDCVVVGLREAVWGFRLALAYEGEVTEVDLEQWCRSSLMSHERPRVFMRVEQLPLLASGKHDRVRIGAMLEAMSGGSGAQPA
ncbi:AMP-binding protein [Thiorhodococcus mannitoliphagus]|uniref:AMP-binding protein n=2 Tax=Thiorhodococcus mannitoliphagus TaxID=329406 RepID=A0A6P1DTC0_9GAMM|nr:AMP-binding protein [Thiorhodococcus mannitoliphagus]